MIKALTLFRKKIKTIAQTVTTIPITAALLTIIIVLTGTTTTGVVNVWAGTFPGPNGQIAFISDREEEQDLEIWVMNADGSGQTRLTNNDAFDLDPSWSPDGEKIAFDSDRDGSGGEIYVMNADGTGQTRLTDNSADDRDPSWSSDGEKIAFDRSDFTGESLEIYVMNADGSGQTRLTDNDAVDRDPSWSPDGEKIAFDSSRQFGDEIWVMNADGSEPTRLTNNDVVDFSPDWGTNTSPPGGPPTPAQVIDKLISTVENLDDDNVPQSVKTSLIAVLKQVSDILSDDNPNNDRAVCGKLGAFINQVNAAERRDTLTADQADELRTQAEDIMDELLGC